MIRIFVPLLVVASCAAAPVFAKKPPKTAGTIALVYYWKVKPGKFDEYSRYISEYAAPIDHEAQRRGAFISVTTYMSQDPSSPWTHMRIFIVRDQAQLDGLQKALDDAKLRLHPSQQERDRQDAYAQTLRDPAGHATLQILP